MKFEIDTNKFVATVLGAAVVAAFAWMWTINERVAKIESPDSMLSRVETLERLIFPIGVEYEVRKRLEDSITGAEPPADNMGTAPTVAVPPNQAVDPKLRENAEDNVRSMIEQRPLEEVKNRRGKPIEFGKKN